MFKKDSLYKNISILVSGTVIAQLIPIALQPILKRIFTPEDFGVFDIYLKILGVLFVVFALKYDMGVVLPKNRVKAQALLLISVLFALLFTAISFLIVLIFHEQILSVLKISNDYSFMLYVLPFSTLFFSLYNSINYLLIRDKRFVASSVNKISRRGIEGVVQIGIGSGIGSGIKSYGLFVGDLLGNFAYFISAYFQSFKGLKFDKRLLNYSFLKNVAIEYSELPKYNLIPSLLNSFFSASLTFIVMAKFSIIDVGFLEATQRLLVVPSAFISVSLGQVILQKVSENIANKIKIIPDLRMLALIMLAISIAFSLFIIFLGPWSFALFLGDTFRMSGVYAQYLIFYFALSFLVSAFGQVLIALKEFKINAIWQVSKFFLIYSLVFFSFDSISTFLVTYNVIGVVVYVLYAIIIIAKAHKYDSSL